MFGCMYVYVVYLTEFSLGQYFLIVGMYSPVFISQCMLIYIGPQHSLRSVFYNDVFAFDLERKRWFKLGVKAKGDTKNPKVKADAKDLTATKVSNPLSEGSSDMVDNRKISGDGDGDGDGDDEEDNNDDDNNENMFGYIDENGNVTYIEMEAEEESENINELKDDVDSKAVLSNVVAEDEPRHPSTGEVVVQNADLPHHVFQKLEDQKVSVVANPAPERESIVKDRSSQQELSDDATSPPGAAGLTTAKGVVVSLGKHFQDLKEPSPRINPAIFIRSTTIFNAF